MSTRSNALDKQAFVPLYFQIQEILLSRIHSGELKEGDLLESEEELSRFYQVSRMTARQALQGLKANGYAVSERGRGTYVAKPKLNKSILMLEGFTEEITRRGGVPSTKLLTQEVFHPSHEVMRLLKLRKTDKVLHLRRLRLANGTPLAVEESNIPLKWFKGIDEVDFSTRSLYETMRDKYNVEFGWADETIEASSATTEESKLLTIPRNASVLCIGRTLVSAQGDPLEFALSRYRADRYQATLRVRFRNSD